MSIAIDNGLPHITVSLGSNPTLDPKLNGLMDTCGALNTGCLKFHLWLMSEWPDLFAEFISFDNANPFEPIKLGGTIRDPSDLSAADHGTLSAVVRYYTPYTDVSGSPITVSFGLGSDITVNTMFGLPMLCDVDGGRAPKTPWASPPPRYLKSKKAGLPRAGSSCQQLFLGPIPLFDVAMFQCSFGQSTDGCNFKELAFYINIVSILVTTVTFAADPNNVSIVHLLCCNLVAFETVSQDQEKWDQKSNNFDSIPNTLSKIRNPIFLEI